MKKSWWQAVKFDRQGLIPAIVQDARSGEVLMVAYMNRQALVKTLRTGKSHFYSRSRGKLWLKGETSGHVQHVRRIYLDCDGDALLVKVRQVGGACHTGYRSCFFRNGTGGKRWRPIGRRLFDPERVYAKGSG